MSAMAIGYEHQDKIPAMISPGEFLVFPGTEHYNKALADALKEEMNPEKWIQEIIDAESAIQPKQIRTMEMKKKQVQEQENAATQSVAAFTEEQAQVETSDKDPQDTDKTVNEDDRIFAVIKSLKINMGKLSEPGRKRLIAMITAYLG